MTGRDLRALRQSLGLTQQQLGDELGIHANTVARLERGELPITRRMETAIDLVRKMAVMRAALDK